MKILISSEVLPLVVSVFFLSSSNEANYILIAFVRSMLHRNNTVPEIQARSSENFLEWHCWCKWAEKLGLLTSGNSSTFTDEMDLADNHCFRLFPFFWLKDVNLLLYFVSSRLLYKTNAKKANAETEDSLGLSVVIQALKNGLFLLHYRKKF